MAPWKSKCLVAQLFLFCSFLPFVFFPSQSLSMERCCAKSWGWALSISALLVLFRSQRLPVAVQERCPHRAGSHRGAPSVLWLISAAAATRGISNHMGVCHPPAEWWMLSLCHTGLLLEIQMRDSCHLSSRAVPPSPINKTAPCKGRWFSGASVTLTQQCCISGCLVLFYLCWCWQWFVKYRYLGFVVCFNSQTSASSSKSSLKFLKSFAWGSEQIASGHIPCYFSQGSIWKFFIL